MNKSVKRERRVGVGALVRRMARRAARGRRRGVVSVVSMMFLILFGSLAAAMAIMSRGNIITAATHQAVTRALGAAETGLAVAEIRLMEAARRFSVAKGEVDEDFGWSVWAGTTGGGWPPGEPEGVSPPKSFIGTGTPDCMADALAQAHAEDENTIEINGITAPTLGQWPIGSDPLVYKETHWLRTPAVALVAQAGVGPPQNAAYQIEYAPLANGTDIRVIVTGYDFDYSQRGKVITRRIMQDFRIVKRVDAAIVSPSRIMIGKNVLVEGDLGATYEELAHDHGDPVVMRSDFFGLDPQLNSDLQMLFDGIKQYDVDMDNRLRVGHPTEAMGIPDLDGSGSPDGSALDLTQDGKVDEFDLFIRRYDSNTDGMVALSNALRDGTPNQSLSAEFVVAGGMEIDKELAWLIDSSRPDRNNNGVYKYQDNNANGKYEPGIDDLLDTEPVLSPLPVQYENYLHTTPPPDHICRDELLGFRDGVIDRRDQYAKVAGRLNFRVSSQAWAAEQGDFMDRVRGPIHPDTGESAMNFQVSEEELPNIDVDSFNSAENTLKAAADGAAFMQQVADNLGVPVNQLPAWTPAQNPPGATSPKYFPLYPDGNQDGMPDNWQTAQFEKAPFNSPNFADWYYRPVFENMTFKNVQIPQGTNALFKDCTFVGVTYVRSELLNTHVNWTLYGKLRMDSGVGRPVMDPARTIYGDAPGENSYPPPSVMPVSATPAGNPPQMILMAVTAMDKGDIPANQIPLTVGYNTLPDPLIMGGLRITDTKLRSNNCRFHDCLFVGSIVSDAPVGYTHVRNKLQFTGITRFVQTHPTEPTNAALNPDPEDMDEIAKSSMMLPNYSVDIGTFNSPPEQDVRLRGAIVAGVLDVRGNASIDGVLLLTFKPKLGEGPLQDPLGNSAGNPALFNTTLGYFGPEDGDEESLDPLTLPIVSIAGVPTKIVGYDVDGDGLPDVGPAGPPPPGSTPVPFWGYGGINMRFDQNLVLPDGLVIPLQIDVERVSYREASK